MIDQLLERSRVTTGPNFGQNRHKRKRKGPFRKQAAHKVGDFESKEERIGFRTGAEIPGEYHIADKAEHSRGERRPTDGRRGLQQLQPISPML